MGLGSLGATVVAEAGGGVLGAAAVHRVREAPAFLAAQVGDVRAEQHGRHGGHPQKAEAPHGGDDRAEREDEEEQHRGAPPPGQDAGAAGTRLHLRGVGAPHRTRPLVPLSLGLGGPAALASARLLGDGLTRRLDGGRRGFARCGPVHGEGADVDRFGRLRLARQGRRVARGALPQLLGVTAFHSRASGQQPDGGTETFRRTGLVQLVLPAEPHRHQICRPSTDDDCVNEATAAHLSHGRGVFAGRSAN
ncbi:hypothetical protein SSBG_05965 [Streptomyces sp. SPB074]|nr:hypothetical protein SSBG_05965 [Streptomyces sp. SPB074]